MIRKSVSLSLLVVLTLIFLMATLLLVLDKFVVSLPWFSIAGVVMGVAGAGLTIYIIVRQIPQRKELFQFEEQMEDQLSILGEGLEELSQGNLTKHLPDPFKRESVSKESLLQKFWDLSERVRNMIFDFNTLTDIPIERMCFVGADTYKQGQQCATEMIQILDGHGKVIISTGNLISSGQEMRRKGFVEQISISGKGIQIAKIIENEFSAEVGYKETMKALQKYPDTTGIYITEGASHSGTVKAIEELGMSSKVKVVVNDLHEESSKLMQAGKIHRILEDDTFSQGYQTPILLYRHLVEGWTPEAPFVVVPSRMVTPQQLREQHNSQAHVDMTLSLTKSEKPLRLMVIGSEISPYWYPIRDGVLQAGRDLESLGVQMEWIGPKDKDLTLDFVGPHLERAITERVDGIALVLDDRDIIPVVNKAVKAGIPVITFITEPSSFRGLIYTINQQTQRLNDLNHNLEKAVKNALGQNKSIVASVDQVTMASERQMQELRRAESSMDQVGQFIQQVKQRSDSSKESAQRTLDATERGSAGVQRSQRKMDIVNDSVKAVEKSIDDLVKSAEKVDQALLMISDIADQVNILSMNAAIEAARAGDSGKGFMVVAGEVRTLAQNTAQTAQNINLLMQEMRQGIVQSKEDMSKERKQIMDLADINRDLEQNFGDIESLVKSDKQNLQDINQGVEAIGESAKSLKEIIEQLAILDKEYLVSVKASKDSSQDLDFQIDMVRQVVNSLQSMIEGQKQLLLKFEH